MSFFRSIILFTILLFCSCISRAQDSNHVYQDTSIAKTDPVVPIATEEAVPLAVEEDEKAKEYEADTILRNNQLSVNPDSIKALKNLKQFGYSKNLDSLLIEYQQSLEKEEAASKKSMSWLARFFLSPFTKYFFWTLAVVFVSFILFKLFFTEGFFQRSYTNTNVAVLPGQDEIIAGTADYAKLIDQALSNGNYRVAVRYHYLQSLQKLSAGGAIQFASDKTNYQYLSELSGKSYKEAFASLTLNYEYVWYGEFEIDEKLFDTIQHQFKQFNNGL